MDNKTLFLSDCEMMGLNVTGCVACHLAGTPAWPKDYRPRTNHLDITYRYMVYTQNPLRLQNLRSVFTLARKYGLIPEKYATKVNELLAATVETLEYFKNERLENTDATFFATEKMEYLHKMLVNWHRWAKNDIVGENGCCWSAVDMFIENKFD